MMTHNFLVASTRPELLARQVTSFARIHAGRSLNFYVFSDTDSRDEEYEEVITELQNSSQAHPAKISHVSLKQQIGILEDFAQFCVPIVGASRQKILDCFQEGGRLQGIRSIQNKMIVIFYLLNKDQHSIIHKVDDDIVAVNAYRGIENVTLESADGYFRSKEQSLSGGPNVISGCNYTIDTPSPLVELANFTEFFSKFFTKASAANEKQVIGNDYMSINPARAMRYEDPHSWLDLLPPSCDSTYEEVLRQLGLYVRMLAGGRSRITLNDTSQHDPTDDTFFPGGCVSLNYASRPGLTPLFGNQDLLWELFEFHGGKKLRVDGFVGHIKTLSSRTPLVDDLTNKSYKHQTCLTYAVHSYLSQHQTSSATAAFYQQFISQTDQWLDEVDEYISSIITILEHSQCWFHKTAYESEIFALKEFLASYTNRKSQVRSHYSHMGQDGRQLVNGFLEMNSLFLRLVDVAKSTPRFYTP